MKKKGHFKKIARVINSVRLVIINLFFWVITPVTVLIVIIATVNSGKIEVPSSAVLDLDLGGTIVNRYTSDEWDRKFKEIMKTPDTEILLSNILKTIEAASEDKRITSIILKTDNLAGGDFASLQAIRQSLVRFRDSGKVVIAYSENFSQTGYYLASAADEVVMDSMGSVSLRGLGVMQSYYKEGLEKLGVEVAVFRTGEFKSFVEPFTETKMSDGVREQTLSWLNSLWNIVLDDICSSREIQKKTLNEDIESYNSRITERWDSEAQLALKSRFIDKIMTTNQFNDYVNGGTSPLGVPTESIYWSDYFSTKSPDLSMSWGNKNIAVVVAEGDIVYGYGSRGVIASHSYAELLDSIAEDKSVAGVVLRINSGGGSAVAAEYIRRAVQRLETKGIPVVASFGGVAASGGYWIGSEARYIFAQPTSITGSIGVFSMIPLVGEAFRDHLGITFDGVGTTSRSLEGRVTTPLSDSEKEYYRKSVNGIYARFKELVINNREIDPGEFEGLAGGRVWSGKQAKKLSLIDEFGGVTEAVKYTAELCGLKQYKVVNYEPVEIDEGSLLGQLIQYSKIKPFANLEKIYDEGIRTIRPDFNDPNGVFAYFSYSLKTQ